MPRRQKRAPRPINRVLAAKYLKMSRFCHAGRAFSSAEKAYSHGENPISSGENVIPSAENVIPSAENVIPSAENVISCGGGDNLTTAICGTANNPLSLPPCEVTFSDRPPKANAKPCAIGSTARSMRCGEAEEPRLAQLGIS